ncbi:MAG: lysophospholipid acyltransferase family protein [Spirulinaceae cyanobacterium]
MSVEDSALTNNREREPAVNLLLYYLFKYSLVSPFLNFYFRGRVYGRENVPKQGPLVIVSNHASYFDPPLLSCVMGRPVAFMAKEELFEVPLLKQGIKLYGAYPVKRSAADRSAIRAAVAALNEGWAAGIFLQGSRTPDGRITKPKLGAATIATKANAPILPVSLWGTQNILKSGSSFPKPVPITVRIGEVIPPPNVLKKEALQTLTQKCTETINEMHSLGR